MVDNAIIYMVMMKLTPDQKKRQPFAFLDGSASAQHMLGVRDTLSHACRRAPLRIVIAVARRPEELQETVRSEYCNGNTQRRVRVVRAAVAEG